MIDINTLNPEQREAVTNFRGPMMILAGAGTGKTRVVTYRIAHMMDRGILPRHIAAMTFTNKAAKEMKDRIGSLVGHKRAQALHISTFHSFCLKLLRGYGKYAGLPSKFSLVGTADQLDLVRRALDEKSWTGLYRVDQLHAQIGQCKNELIGPDDIANGILPKQADCDPELLSVVYALYERQLELNRAIDFDDCIFKVVKMLRSQDKIKEKLQGAYQYMLVDEFQDTNAAQFSVLEELALGSGNICVVGDDDQSIYSWRGAMFETLERFERTFAGTKVVKLEQNYRCSNVILGAANHVIKNNVHRKEKTLWSQSEVNKPIVIAGLDDPSEEARWISEKCLSLLGRGFKPCDIAILYRANAQAKAIELALRECNLFYKTFGGQSFFEKKEVKDFLAYLRLVINPDDHLSLWRIINTPPRGIGLKTQEQIELLAKSRHCSPFAVMANLDGTELPTSSRRSIEGFVALMEELCEMPLASSEDCAALGNAILEKSGLLDHCKQGAKNVLSRKHKVNNLRSLPKWLEKTASDQEAERGDVDCYKLLDSLTLGDEQRFNAEEENPMHISLMTVHASKGLEFPAVFIAGMEEGSLPHKNSIEDGDMQIAEERRLFYVALTRAKAELFLSYAAVRQSGFQKEERKKSRFLLELPEHSGAVEEHMGGRINASEKKQDEKKKTLSKLSAIKESLMDGSWD